MQSIPITCKNVQLYIITQIYVEKDFHTLNKQGRKPSSLTVVFSRTMVNAYLLLNTIPNAHFKYKTRKCKLCLWVNFRRRKQVKFISKLGIFDF